MSVTAFPVLARILSERGLLRTRIGSLSIACAAIDEFPPCDDVKLAISSTWGEGALFPPSPLTDVRTKLLNISPELLFARPCLCRRAEYERS